MNYISARTDNKVHLNRKFEKYAAAYHNIFSLALHQLLSLANNCEMFDEVQRNKSAEKIRKYKISKETFSLLVFF